MGDRSGVIINDVVEGSPAEKAGLQDGDVILRHDGEPVSDYAAFTRAVRALHPGDRAKFVVLRDGREKTLEVEIGRREADDEAGSVRIFRGGEGDAGRWKDLGELKELEGLKELKSLKELKGLEGLEGLEGLDELKMLEDGNARVFVLPRGGHDAPGVWFEGESEGKDGDDEGGRQRRIIMRKVDDDRGWLGVHMDALGEQLGEYFGVKDGAGVLVTEVVGDSPAAKAGLTAGDVIVKAGDRVVASPDDLHETMAGTKPGDALELKVVRKGSTRTLNVKLGEMPADAVANKRIEIVTDGEPGELKLMAPRLRQQLDREAREGGERDRQVIIERKRQADEDLSAVREEMEALRQELKELRRELERAK